MAGGGLIASAVDTAISNSYSNAPVVLSTHDGVGSCVGGLAGALRLSRLTNSYSTAAVSGGDNTQTGGLIGNLGIIHKPHASYWDIDTSGTDQGTGNKGNVTGIIGLTDAQLKSGLPDGFDPKIWGQSPNINNGYPYLRANPPPK